MGPLNYLKKKKVKKKSNLRKIVQKQGKCQNCFTDVGLTAHHIIFRSQGGDDSFGNLVTLCENCHRYAHDGLYVCGEYITARDFMIGLLENINHGEYIGAIEELKKRKNE